VIGLVGVIVGALLSGGATWVMTARTEKRKARAAARLLEGELLRVNQALDELLDTSRQKTTVSVRRVFADFWIEGTLKGLTLDRWFEHQSLLAEVLVAAGARVLSRLAGTETAARNDELARRA
jgi:hypothetical protein